MTTFFVWLISQAVFARVLFALVLMTWRDMHLPAETIGWFIVPVTVVCFVETIVSGCVAYPLILNNRR